MPPLPAILLTLLVTLAIAGCLTAWTWTLGNWSRGQAVVPYQPRRPVPWRGIDVALIAFVYVVAPSTFVYFGHAWFDVQAEPPPRPAADVKLKLEHPIVRVLQATDSVPAIFVCLVAAVIVAPIAEELLFRLLLQGWLESVERRWRRRFRAVRHLPGVLPILLVSLLFASLHMREPSAADDPSLLVTLLAAYSLGCALTVAVMFVWLRLAVGATITDLGIVPGHFREDVKLGAMAFVAWLVPVYIVSALAKSFLPENVVADPVPLFVLALVLGGLYYRTHRIVPSIVLHTGINAAGVFMALAFG